MALCANRRGCGLNLSLSCLHSIASLLPNPLGRSDDRPFFFKKVTYNARWINQNKPSDAMKTEHVIMNRSRQRDDVTQYTIGKNSATNAS